MNLYTASDKDEHVVMVTSIMNLYELQLEKTGLQEFRHKLACSVTEERSLKFWI